MFVIAEGRCEGVTWPTVSPIVGWTTRICVCAGEVRGPSDPGQTGPDLVVDVAELIWEPIAD